MARNVLTSANPIREGAERKLAATLREGLAGLLPSDIAVAAHCNLYYSLWIDGRGQLAIEGRERGHIPRGDGAFEADLVIHETRAESSHLIPRVAVELKTRGVSTHDLLIYAAKAERHRQVYPYLRYGMLVLGDGSSALPSKVVRHGSAFDFVCVYHEADLDHDRLVRFGKLVMEEVETSRKLTEHLRRPQPKGVHIMRRPVVFEA